jgi:spore coat polysaccharide biosynthesis protein SpsF
MKIGFLITARLKSSRLKRKIVLPLNGKTVLDHVIDRCKQTNFIKDVVLCTSINPQDAELFDYALNHQIKFYAGSEDDVLKRLLDAAKYFGFDAFMSITADNPLHSIFISNKIVNWVKKENSDFIFTSGLPLGLTPYFMNTKALEVAVAMKERSDTEIWGPFVNRPDFFKIGYLKIENELFEEDVRLTCDYLEDYNLFKAIFNKFPEDYNPSIFEVSDLIKKGKVEITNGAMNQTNVHQETINKIKLTFDSNLEKGKSIAKQIGYILDSGERNLTIKI